ncbi:hypothetical protein NKH18_44160 [Streptomyces sp. M10(2022)]
MREPHLTDLLEQVTEGSRRPRPGRVVGYRWGGQHGAVLGAGGASIPDGPGAGIGRGVHGPGEPDDETEEWARLYDDPQAELALAASGSARV